MAWGPHWVRRVLGGLTVEELQRFDAALDATRTELGRRRGDGDEPWRDAAQTEIDNAGSHRAGCKLEAAWSALKTAEREMIRSFGPSELVAEARIVRNEADEKLTGWRRASVDDLLPAALLDGVGLVSGGLALERAIKVRDAPAVVETPSSVDRVDEPPTSHREEDDAAPSPHAASSDSALVDDLRTRLVKAKQVLDTHSDNVYHKFRLLRRAVISTTTVFAVLLGALVAIVALDWVPSTLITENSPLDSWRMLLVVMSLGTIGAFLSSATELTNRNEKLSVPDLRVSYTLMGMRPVVGAAGATVVIVVLQSALGGAVTLEPTAILGVAIAAGFTERLVTRTVSSAATAVSK